MTNKKLLAKIEGKHHDRKPRYSRKPRFNLAEQVKKLGADSLLPDWKPPAQKTKRGKP